MFLKSRSMIAIFILLSLPGCAHFAKNEDVTATAASVYEKTLLQQMSKAESLEMANKYSEAVREYILIADSRPVTIYHKNATKKAATLSIHPDNPGIDYGTSLKYFNALLELPLLPFEHEYARLHIKLIERIMGLENEVVKLVKRNKKLVSDSRVRAKNIAEKLKKNRELESELSRLQEEIIQMKQVDLFLHKSRKTSVQQ